MVRSHVYGPTVVHSSFCASHGTISEKATVRGEKLHSQTGQLRANQGLAACRRIFVRRAEEWRDDEAALMAYTAAVIANFFLVV